MKGSLRALLTDIVDYAGLFPPAKLPLDPAIRKYAAYQRCEDAWMLARFVCPAGQLRELTVYRDQLYADGPALRLSVLVGGGATRKDYEAQLAADFAAIAGFQREFGERAVIEALEVKLPADIANAGDDHKFVIKCLGAVDEDVASNAGARLPRSEVSQFFEVPPGPDWLATALYVIQMAGSELSQDQQKFKRWGFKLRTGGLEAAAFPSIERVAFVLTASRNANVPLKFTAGLHHPLRAYREEVRTKMHGFINIFAAACLAHLYPIDPLRADDLRVVLGAESPDAFDFHDDYFVFNQQPVPVATIAELRRESVISFGSCSFDEPREDLQALGWF